MRREENGQREGWKVAFTAPDAKILIVDDNRVNLKMAEGLLRPYHMQVDTAGSGERAVEMVQTIAYDLVFMDYLMPGMNGTDAAKIIRSMEKEIHKRPIIVALSADGEQGIRDLFLEAGMDDFLPKPVERCSIEKILRKWLPGDMIVLDANGSEDGAKAAEEKKLQVWQIEGIDVAAGMSYSDNDQTLYLEVLTDFADNIEERANQIERAMKEGNLAAYIVEVHSLKSAAGYLGATAVADMAQALEAEAKRNDWESVCKGTPQLLFSYRKLYHSIAPYRIDRGYVGKKKSLDREAVISLLDKLSAYMEDYDVDGSEEVIQKLETYDFGEMWTGYMDRILKAADRFDYSACKAAALFFKQALEKEP